MRITIVGGGNIGTQFAVHCAQKGHDVSMYTSAPELYDGHINIVDEKGEIIHEGDLVLATNDPEQAFGQADWIMVTVPATMMQDTADLVYRYANPHTVIGVVPGSGGSECAFRDCIHRGNDFFGIERVPAVARLVQKGKTVRSTGYRDELHVAAIPGDKAAEYAALIESIFDTRTTVVPNYLNLTMTPSNPILHTTRLRTLFGDWHEGVTYDSVPLFYEEWDDASSELLFVCDEEVQQICRALPWADLSYVRSLKEHYESPTIEAMTKKISSIDAFKGLTTPVVQTEKGLIPDLHSRYFTADFYYGLTILQQIGKFASVSSPHIDATMQWYRGIAIEKDEFRFEDYGITSEEELRKFYLIESPIEKK